MNLAKPIGGNTLLAALAPSELDLLLPHFRKTLFDPDQVLQEAETAVQQVWFPLSGMISLLVANSNEAPVETAMVGREGVVGAFAGLGPWRASSRAVVQLAGHGLAIPVHQFREIARGNEHIRNLIVLYGEVLLAQAQQTCACNALHPLEQRLARWLLQALDRIDGNTLPLTQEFLSGMLGVRRTSVSLAAQQLELKGVIRSRRANIEIVDRQGLQLMACECYAAIRRRELYFAQQLRESQ